MIWTPNILQFSWRMDQRSLKQNYNESLAMSLFRNSLFFTFYVCSLSSTFCGGSSSGLWRLESVELHQFMICWGFSDLWDLGRWFGWFLFECSSYLKVRGGSSSGLWRLAFVELYQFVVCWDFWRLLSLIPVTFEI